MAQENGDFFKMNVTDAAGYQTYDYTAGMANAIGSPIVGVYTTDGEAPYLNIETGDTNVNTKGATELKAPLYKYWLSKHTSGGGAGFVDVGNKSGDKEWKNNLGIRIQPIIGTVHYSGFLYFNHEGAFSSFIVNRRDDGYVVEDGEAYLVGRIHKYDDGSKHYSYYWFIIKRNGKQEITTVIVDYLDGVWNTNDPDGDGEVGDYPTTPEPSGDAISDPDPTNNGGNGTQDFTPTPIPYDNRIPNGIEGTGLATIYKVNQAQLNQLGGKLWSQDFFDNIIKSFYSPMDAVIALNVVPSIANTTVIESKEIFLGNYGTDINAQTVRQFFELDMGGVFIEKRHGNAHDYNPYTQIDLYLPYIGTVQISPDDVMGHTLKVKYKCDVVTGNVVAWVMSQTSEGDDTVIGTYAGNFVTQIPLTGANYAEVYKAAISGTIGVLSAGAGVAAGGATMAVGATQGISSASNVVSSKIQYLRGSGMGMSAGLMNNQRAYVVITTPKESIPQNFASLEGYPSNTYHVLSELKGTYCVVEAISLSIGRATEAEKDEIEKLLKGGVYV
jgi:hypothetical protein